MIDCHVLVESGITNPNSKYHSENTERYDNHVSKQKIYITQVYYILNLWFFKHTTMLAEQQGL